MTEPIPMRIPCPDKGEKVRGAASMSVGVCRCGDLIGIDLHDKSGKPFAHAHLDAGSAIEFAEALNAAIEQVLRNAGVSIPEEKP